MKKKIRPINKYKKKLSFELGYLVWVLQQQYKLDKNSMNLMSFIRTFRYFNMRSVYPIMAILGFRFNTKIFVLKKVLFPGRSIFKLMRKDFYKDYSIDKKKNIDNLEYLYSFRSFRFHFSFPLNGQKTRTHAKTRKKYSIM